MLFSGKNIIVTWRYRRPLAPPSPRRLIAQGRKMFWPSLPTKPGWHALSWRCPVPGALQTFVADVSDSEQVRGYATRAFELWEKVGGFVKQWRASRRRCVRSSSSPEEDFDRVLAVNIRGVFLGMKYVLPRMRDGGSVVNMSSALGVVGGAGIVAYVASKHAHHRHDQDRRARTRRSPASGSTPVLPRTDRRPDDLQAG